MAKKVKKKKKLSRIVPVLCRLAGTAILLIVILVTASIVVPQIRGYQVYHIVSGSMEPEIPVGSAAYIDTKIRAEDVQEKDVIAFKSGSSLVVHRVVQNQIVEGFFRTKGDANEGEDLSEIPYKDFVGRVYRHIPYVGQIIMIFTTGIGKVYVLCFALCGVLFNMLGHRLSQNRKEN